MNEYVTADQVRQMLHISKRKCAWMLQNGLLPCENTGKKTRQYRIRSEDVIAYQAKNAGCPDVLPQIFSSVSPRQPRVPPADFCERLSKLWSALPDALTEQDVARLLGYTVNTVGRWISNRRLRAVTAHGETLVAKQWLIDFSGNTAFGSCEKAALTENRKHGFYTKFKNDRKGIVTGMNGHRPPLCKQFHQTLCRLCGIGGAAEHGKTEISLAASAEPCAGGPNDLRFV